MNKMDKLCDLLGLKLFDKFNIIKRRPNILQKVQNPYYFNDEGMLNKWGVQDNALLADLVNGSLGIQKIGENVLDTPIDV